MRKLTIGELAKRAGVGVETVRYYQRKGLLPVPPRRQGGFREYPASTLASLRFIRRAKGLGFALKEIAELLQLRKTGTTRCEDLRPRLAAKAVELQARAEALMRTSASLAAMVKACEAMPKHVQCESIAEIFPDDD